MPRYESGKIYGSRSRSGGKGGGGRPPSGDGRRVKAGSPVGARPSSAGRGKARRKPASSSKRPPRRWVKVAVIALVAAAFLALGGYTTIKTVLLSQFVGVVVARDGQVEELVSAKAFFVRHEKVLHSPVTGTIALALAEGARVRKDAEVASLSDVEERQQAEDRVAQLESDLTAFNNTNGAEEAALADAIAKSQAAAKAKAAALRVACLGSDFVAIGQDTAELASASRDQAEAAGRLDVIRQDRAAIEEALATARAALQQTIFPIPAPEAGFVSYSLDGLEETLTPDSIGDYGTKQLVTSVGALQVTADQSRVDAGQAVAKIIGDTESYVSTIVTNQEAERLSAVNEVTLRFPAFEGRRETTAILFHVGDREKNGYCLVTYRVEGILEGMIPVRQVDASIVVQVYRGTVLPRKAVVHRGGEDGVFVLEGGLVCRFHPVDIVGESGGEVVVSGLDPGTQVISNPWLVREGTRIGQASGGNPVA